MSKLQTKLKAILKEEIEEKLKQLPLAYGEEEGCEGFPRWCIYINKDGELLGDYKSLREGEKNINLVDKILSCPLERIIMLIEKGISGDDLFLKINEDYTIRNKMIYEARKDAEDWQNSKLKVKP